MLKYFCAIIILLILVLNGNISSSNEYDKYYILDCEFVGLPDSSRVYLLTQQKDTLQNTVSNGGRFHFRGTLQPEGRFLFICFDSEVTESPSKAIFVLNKEMVIKGIIGKREVIVTGSDPHTSYMSIIKTDKAFNMSIRKEMLEQDELVRKIYVDSVGGIKDLETTKKLSKINDVINELKLEHARAKREWILSNSSSFLTPYIIEASLNEIGLDFAATAFGQLTKEVKEGYYGEQLAKKLVFSESSAKFKKGALIPNIIVKDKMGKVKYIHDIIQMNKLTLIDCWASWCSPCRAETPNLQYAYSQYKEKGLNIIGISTDRDVSKWIKAIVEDKTTWDHFIEIKDNPFSKMCGIEAIPAYILLDSSGRMIAFDCAKSSVKSFGGGLRGKNLVKTIERELYSKAR